MRAPSLQMVRGPDGLRLSSAGPSIRHGIRRRVLLALLGGSLLLLGWIGGVGWAWKEAREYSTIKTPVFVRVTPAACVFEAWAANDDPHEIPAGAVRALHMTDPARSRGWAPCWPLFEAVDRRETEARLRRVPNIGLDGR